MILKNMVWCGLSVESNQVVTHRNLPLGHLRGGHFVFPVRGSSMFPSRTSN